MSERPHANAVEKAVAVMERIGRLEVECSVCRGGWFASGGEWIGAVHAKDCPRSEDDPPGYTR